MRAEIAITSPPYSTLTYALPEVFPQTFWACGMRVAVPLGAKSLRAGIIVSICHDAPEMELKNIFWPLDSEPLIDCATQGMVMDLAARQGVTPGLIWANTLPQGLRSVRQRIVSPKFGSLCLKDIGALAIESQKQLAAEFLSGAARWATDEQKNNLCLLKVDPPWPVRPQAIRQRDILDYLYQYGPAPKRVISGKFGLAPLARLIGSSLVELGSQDVENNEEGAFLPPPPQPFSLAETQKKAVAGLLESLAAPDPRFALLHGVTGSGKTAVYMELVKASLAAGRNSLLLAPEVALAQKLFRDFTLAGIRAFLYHGYQTPASRAKMYRFLSGVKDPWVLVGTRSALFLPLGPLGLIIMDEEHDSSFKQDENFSYHAKELAWYRVARDNGLLLLGSATPDIKTFHAAQKGALKYFEMPARVTGHALPAAELVDIGKYSGIGDEAGRGILAQETEAALLDCLKRGEQSVILLNRRGYAPMMYCLDCGKTLRCPHCAIGLAYHKTAGRLICHYCGYSVPHPSQCPKCGKMNFLPIGEGTERVAERLEALAGCAVLRLDRDSARRPGRMEDMLAAFARHESPFLTGTQMLSKGHHFPDVTLVVVADADIGLNFPDYRASEKTFQLLVQAAGRGGRGAKPARVLIQTRDKSHYCWEFVRNYDYRGFCQEELARREKSQYPPFTRLALLRISHPLEETQAMGMIGELGSALKIFCKNTGVTFLGPVPAPIAVLRGRRRYHCLMKSQSWNAIRQTYFFARDLKCAAPFRLFLDLDPVNML